MKPSASSGPARGLRLSRLGRIARHTAYVKATLVAVVLVVVCAFYLRLVAGPVSLADYSDRVGGALAARLGEGWAVSIGDASLELAGSRPAVQISGLDIRNPSGVTVMRAPHAIVSLDPVSLLVGTFSVREIELRGLQLRARLGFDGSLSFVAQVDRPAGEVPTAVPPAEAAASPLASAIASLLDPVLRPTGIIGALDRAVVEGARVTLVGPDGGERATFSKVSAIFEREGDRGRTISLDLEGPTGSWQVRGRMEDGAERRADLSVEAVPVSDLLLLSSLSGAGISTDLKLSGSLSAALAGPRLTRLEGSFESTAGSFPRAGRPAIVVDRASGEARWDEARRVLTLAGLALESEGSRMRLEGELAPGAVGWELKLVGRDGVVAGLTRGEAPFRVDEVSAGLTIGEAGVSLDRALVRGEGLDLAISGASVPGENGTGLRASVEARGTDVRRLLRFWPDALAGKLREFLVEKLRSGTVERLELAAGLDSEGGDQGASRPADPRRRPPDRVFVEGREPRARRRSPGARPALDRRAHHGDAGGPDLAGRQGRASGRPQARLLRGELRAVGLRREDQPRPHRVQGRRHGRRLRGLPAGAGPARGGRARSRSRSVQGSRASSGWRCRSACITCRASPTSPSRSTGRSPISRLTGCSGASG